MTLRGSVPGARADVQTSPLEPAAAMRRCRGADAAIAASEGQDGDGGSRRADEHRSCFRTAAPSSGPTLPGEAAGQRPAERPGDDRHGSRADDHGRCHGEPLADRLLTAGHAEGRTHAVLADSGRELPAHRLGDDEQSGDGGNDGGDASVVTSTRTVGMTAGAASPRAGASTTSIPTGPTIDSTRWRTSSTCVGSAWIMTNGSTWAISSAWARAKPSGKMHPRIAVVGEVVFVTHDGGDLDLDLAVRRVRRST